MPLSFFDQLFCQYAHGFRVGQLPTTIPLKHDGLNLFASHDRASASPARRAPVVILNDGKTDVILPGRTDGDRTSSNPFPVLRCVFFDDLILGLVGVHAPQMARLTKVYPLRVNHQDRGFVAFPLDDDPIVSRGIHGFRHPAPGIGFGIEAGLRRLGENAVPGGPPDQASAHRTCGKDQVIFWAERMDLRRVQLGKEIGCKPFTS